MKNIIIYCTLFFMTLLWTACEKKTDADGILSPITNVDNVRKLYKGQDVQLNTTVLEGAEKIVGLVVSDHQHGNIPSGFVVMQSARSPKIRGINLDLGNDALSFIPGDSIVVNINGAVLSKQNGTLVIKGLSRDKVEKVSSGNTPLVQTVSVDGVNKTPGAYESTLVQIYGCTFNRIFGEPFSGDKEFHDGGVTTLYLHTEQGADFASENLPKRAVTSGIVFIDDHAQAKLWPRAFDEITNTGVDVDPNIPLGKSPIIITGFLSDPTGSDANYEYIQLMATQDIDFEVTPFSLVTTNNAGTATPLGFPANGWATGDLRTYKFNLSSGTVAKGHFFYVGGYKKIWGSNSADISAANWIVSYMYADLDGADFGTATANLLANSGNPGGIAIFKGTTVNDTSEPVDVIFYGGANGSIFSPGPPKLGYRITNTDSYLLKHATTNADQNFFREGTNTFIFAFPATSNFAKLGGVYNPSTEKWTTKRVLTNKVIGNNSTITDLESDPGMTKLE